MENVNGAFVKSVTALRLHLSSHHGHQERLQDTEKTNCHRREGTRSLTTDGGGDNWTQLKHIGEEKQHEGKKLVETKPKFQNQTGSPE